MPKASVTGLPPLSEAQVARSEKFSSLINRDHTDLGELRQLVWRGCPTTFRPICWRLMTGLLPTARERRSSTLAKKRKEYWKLVSSITSL